MKTLTKILLGTVALALFLKFSLNVNPVVTFISCMIIFVLSILGVSLADALKVKNADDEAIKAYHKRVEQFRRVK